MRYYLFIILVVSFQVCKAQEAFHNFGNVQIHDQGQIGFHIDLENDGTFNNNLGLAGFYNINSPLTISGTETPRFFDMEVAVDNNLFLEINTEIINSLSYIIGDVITPRSNPAISLDYLSNSFFASEDDLRLTDGYASFTGVNNFTFPVGQDDKLRPLKTPFQDSSTLFKAAYFNEDPNFPSTFTTSFNTTLSQGILSTISTEEFWDFNGTQATTVTLTWDQESQINNLVDDLMNLRVVGWSETENEWIDLGNTDVIGDINNGEITSMVFTPNDYTVITFGSLIGSDGLVTYNGISPNGDGLNEVFVIEGVELFENQLKIYNRWGRIVYDAKNYQNDWNGISNKDVVLDTSGKLPVGTYFYSLELPTENKSYAGWIYINY